MPAHALVVEDEPHILELLALHLGLEGVTVSECADGALALDAVALNAETPVLILTARREESDTVANPCWSACGAAGPT